MKEWSLISCQVFFNLIRHYRRNLELLNWQMEVSKSIELKGAVNCGRCVLEKNIYFIMIFPPHFKFLLSNERLDFCDFF